MTHQERLDALDRSIALLTETNRKLQRTAALMKMSRPDHPYYPLIRVMCKLKLIKDWPIY